jgi:hypothetical protein
MFSTVLVAVVLTTIAAPYLLAVAVPRAAVEAAESAATTDAIEPAAGAGPGPP